MPLAALFAMKKLVFVSYFCPEVCVIPQLPFLHTRGNNCGGNLVFVRAVGTQPQSTPYSYHKVLWEWKPSSTGRAKKKQNRREFCLGQVPRASVTSVPVKRDTLGTWPFAVLGPELQGPSSPLQGAGEMLTCCRGAVLQGCCAAATLAAASLRGWPDTRQPSEVSPGALPVCSMQVSLSSFLQHSRAWRCPLSSLLDLWRDGETSMLSLGWSSGCSGAPQSCQPYQNDGCYPGVSCQCSCSTQPPAPASFPENRTLSPNMLRKVQIYL